MKALMTVVVVALATSLAGCGIPYSDGVRVGTVQKVSRKGLIWRTFEGEMVMDGIRVRGTANGAGITNIWKFSAQDQGVVDQIEKAAESGARVKLTYDQKLFPAPWASGTGYVITKVEVLGTSAAN